LARSPVNILSAIKFIIFYQPVAEGVCDFVGRRVNARQIAMAVCAGAGTCLGTNRLVGIVRVIKKNP